VAGFDLSPRRPAHEGEHAEHDDGVEDDNGGGGAGLEAGDAGLAALQLDEGHGEPAALPT